jgi:probable H4MPT-linked C1 transfer pathway protein
MTQPIITGWDIGGAHLKVAQCTQQGELLHAFEVPCPLWQGIDELNKAVKTAQKKLICSTSINAITMTGELVDIFPDRQSGVDKIISGIQPFLSEGSCHIYAGEQGWLTPSEAKKQWRQVASRNWQASVSYSAQTVEQGLFIDVGSTTSDIIAIHNYQAQPVAFNDFERQAISELHYSGAIRTPLIAIAHTAPFDNKTIRLTAEVFATSGDCWCILGQLDPATIQDNAADGQPWQKSDCIRRLARLLGTDAHDFPEQQWQQLAQWFAQQQIMQLQQACQTVLANHSIISQQAPLIGAGIGRYMVQQCAEQLGKDYIDFSSLTNPSSPQAADNAPAAAIALLASQQLS